MAMIHEEAIKISCDWRGCNATCFAHGNESVHTAKSTWGTVLTATSILDAIDDNCRLVKYVCPEHFKMLKEQLESE